MATHIAIYPVASDTNTVTSYCTSELEKKEAVVQSDEKLCEEV